jgi:hypothetical protein
MTSNHLAGIVRPAVGISIGGDEHLLGQSSTASRPFLILAILV